MAVARDLDLRSTLQKTGADRCIYGAPYIAVVADGKGVIKQACCNHWDCPRCKLTLSAQHKFRMVSGANILLESGPLYFWTITCRGKDLDRETADDDYYLWTNRLLATCRARAKKQGMRWEYVQVTERQKRGAAHSHFIHTFCPDDAVSSTTKLGKSVLLSEWFRATNVSAGLGPQCVISRVESATGVAAYISGYLQKQLSADLWPKSWKRIRYSRGWPSNAPEPEWKGVLMSKHDWEVADRVGVTFVAEDRVVYGVARHHMARVAPPEWSKAS